METRPRWFQTTPVLGRIQPRAIASVSHHPGLHRRHDRDGRSRQRPRIRWIEPPHRKHASDDIPRPFGHDLDGRCSASSQSRIVSSLSRAERRIGCRADHGHDVHGPDRTRHEPHLWRGTGSSYREEVRPRVRSRDQCGHPIRRGLHCPRPRPSHQLVDEQLHRIHGVERDALAPRGRPADRGDRLAVQVVAPEASAGLVLAGVRRDRLGRLVGDRDAWSRRHVPDQLDVRKNVRTLSPGSLR